MDLFVPASIEEACAFLAENKGARPLAGGTDILSARERGTPLPPTLVWLSGLGLGGMEAEGQQGIRIGSLVTHRALSRDGYIKSSYSVLAEASASVGSPQVRSIGSLGGNLCNASPAADGAAALIALGARVEIVGVEGMRTVPVEGFFKGPGRNVLAPGEIVTGIVLPEKAPDSAYLKLGRRAATEIAVVGVAVALWMKDGVVGRCRIGLGAVAPTPIRAYEAEAALTGREITADVISHSADAAARECSPIDDHRASSAYRRAMVKVLLGRAIHAASQKREADSVPFPAWPDVKNGRPKQGPASRMWISLRVNGEFRSLEVTSDKLLVDVLREDFGLTGTKKGCGEGECGTCTVLLDNMPVSSCLVLAATVDTRAITTVEGLAIGRLLSPLQKAFVKEGAVQCGYCTPGMLMSASALLRENSNPDEKEIREALSGNLCRCTGYKKIVQAVRTIAALPPAALNDLIPRHFES